MLRACSADAALPGEGLHADALAASAASVAAPLGAQALVFKRGGDEAACLLRAGFLLRGLLLRVGAKGEPEQMVGKGAGQILPMKEAVAGNACAFVLGHCGQGLAEGGQAVAWRVARVRQADDALLAQGGKGGGRSR